MDDSSPLLSVIIPCYNVEAFLEEAVVSVINSGVPDMEIILINDGSTDRTDDICRALASQYRVITYLSQSNAGPSAARNAGLAVARGKWLTFVDSDDMVVSRNLADLLNMAIKYDADIIQGDYIPIPCNNDKDPKVAQRVTPETISMEMSGIEAACKSLYQKIEKGGGRYWGINNSMWGKIYKRRVWDGMEYPNGKVYEDLAIFYKLALRAEKVILTNLPVYMYRENPESITHVFNRKRLDVLDITAAIEQDAALHYPELLSAARDRRFAANYNMYRLMNTSPYKKEYADDIRNSYNYIRCHARNILSDPKSRIKNKTGALLAIILPSKVLSKI